MGRRRWWQKRLHGVQVIEGGALFWRELSGVPGRSERGLALIRWKCAKLTKRVRYSATTILGKTGELLHGAAHALSLLRGEMLYDLGTIQHVLTLLRRHIVELRQPISHALLDLWRKIPEARLMLKGALLSGCRKIAVMVHPLRQVLLPRPRTYRSMLGGLCPLLLAAKAAARSSR